MGCHPASYCKASWSFVWKVPSLSGQVFCHTMMSRWARAEKDTTWCGLGPRSYNLMLKFGYIFLAVTACSLVLKASGYNPREASTSQDLNAQTLGGKSMDPFVKVIVCAPVNVKIVPGPEHKVAVTADDGVTRALSLNVHEGKSAAAAKKAHGQATNLRFAASTRICLSGTLFVEATRGFRTNGAIQVTLVVPNNQLELVNIKSPKSTVAIGLGFSVRRFTGVIANKAELHIYGLNADEAVLKTTGYSLNAIASQRLQQLIVL